MKLLIVGDVHWSTYSSILRKRGELFSKRLENLINSVSWAEEQADINNCDTIVYLGDFFDKPELNAEELTALQQVKWSNKKHYFIVGNHESPTASLKYNSTKALDNKGFNIIDSPTQIEGYGYKIMFIPFTIEDNRKSLSDYWKLTEDNNSLSTQELKNTIIFSHNDIKGIRYGKFESKTGFSLDDIKNSCNLYVNGHLHNGEYLDSNKKILNLGNLTGQNFSEDASRYSHNVGILDTETMILTRVENPFAFNFYKILIDTNNDIKQLDKLKNNAVISIKCNEKLIDKIKEKISQCDNICEYRLVIYRDSSNENIESKIKLNNVDHLKQFQTFVLDKLELSDELEEELSIICS